MARGNIPRGMFVFHPLKNLKTYLNLGKEVTPRRRAVIIAYRKLDRPLSYKKIQQLTGLASFTANDIYRYAENNATMKLEMGKAKIA